MRRSPAVPLAVLLVLGSLLALVPPSQAAYGSYGPDGWPLDVNGASTNPYPGTILGAPWAKLDLVTNPQMVLPGITSPTLDAAGITVYPYYPILVAELTTLADAHPDKVRLHTIGQSTLGLDLFMLEIANFDAIDAGDGIPLEEREVVWVDGGTHSNEYSGVYFVTSLASFLLDEYDTNETAQWIVDNRHTWLMPMVNPDGSNLFGRLNANTVNINRNYPVDWGETEEDPIMNNPGPHPESEIETRINIEWFNITQPDYYASVHCCGNLWLFPYGVEGWDPADKDMLDRVCDEGLPDVGDACGPIWSTIYPASGSSVDTAYEYTGTVAFGYEMSGRGAVSFWGQPFTSESVRIQERESWAGVLHAFQNVHLYGAYLEPIGMGISGSESPITFTFRNTGYGNMTEGQITVSTAAGDIFTTTIPPMAANETRDIQLAQAVPAGNHTMTIEYAKRIQAAPMRIETHTLDIAIGPSDFVVMLDGNSLGIHHTTLREQVPTTPVALIVTALAAAIMLGRRRS